MIFFILFLGCLLVQQYCLAASPTRVPSRVPSRAPTRAPSRAPTRAPSRAPTRIPTRAPTRIPSRSLTQTPTALIDFPNFEPTAAPTEEYVPESRPSRGPSRVPTRVPSQRPTRIPALTPSRQPTRTPTFHPATRTWDYDLFFTVQLDLQDVDWIDFNSAFYACFRAVTRTVAEILPGVNAAKDVSFFRILMHDWYSTDDVTSIQFDVQIPKVLNLGYSGAENALSVATRLLEGAASAGSFTIRLRHFAQTDAGSRLALSDVVVNASSILVSDDWVSVVSATAVDDDSSQSSDQSFNIEALIVGVVLGTVLLCVLVSTMCYFYWQRRQVLTSPNIEEAAVAGTAHHNSEAVVIAVDSDHLSADVDVVDEGPSGHVVAVIEPSALSLV